ncbi:adenylate/guanylate cyclase domain-containing protein [Azospirillum agricola]|uniref:adenylate/guanylate cyclase domain-containing protein n=1 Tax=Azospirillum agricola TaxID=1720247 RepID=UPI000A0F0228|nr:adenylate/guanylate cyclase domain-containing protein [Azospirillum agricola]SMH58369.1 Adenylate cyclase, class 3 [Azospirillum lipoferum]
MSPLEKPLALLFVDIADSVMLYERIGDATAASLTQRILARLRRLVDGNGGGVIKSSGDGLLGAFPAADDGVRAALAMMAVQDEYGLRLRAGLHFGPVIAGTGDLYGDACNVAARVQQIARPGEILATEALAALLSPALMARTRLLGNVAIKGKAAPVRVHRIRPAGEPDEAPDSTTLGFSMVPGTAMPTLHLSYGGQTILMSPTLPRVAIGREAGSGLRIASRQASRQHAVIDFSRESFLLTDHSSNGTFIRSGGSPPLVLRRDSTRLVGHGLIGFGAEALDARQDHVVAFRGELT